MCSCPNGPNQNIGLIRRIPRKDCILKDTNIRRVKISKYYISKDRISDIVSMICEAKDPVSYPFKSDSFCLPLRQALLPGGTSSLIPGNSILIESRENADSSAWGWQMMATKALIGSNDACCIGRGN